MRRNTEQDLTTLTETEIRAIVGGAKHVLPIGPIDGIPPIVITPIIGPIIGPIDVELDPSTL